MRKYFSIINLVLLFWISGMNSALAQSPPKPRDTTIQGPQTFAMIMGISKYKFVRPLEYADKDAEMFANFLKSPAGGSLTDDNIYMLLNENATLANFYVRGFQWLKAKKLQSGDRLFIYLAGHGDAIDEDQFFYLAFDCNPAGDKNNYLVSGAIQMLNVKIKIQRETSKGVQVFLVMDACRSNELPGGAEGQSFFNQAISQKRAGEVMMLATAAGQESMEDRSIGTGHGLFTYYLVDGLNGIADSEGNKDDKVSVAEIQKYVDEKVPAVAKTRFNRVQNPYFCCSDKSGEIVSIVDPAYLKKWEELKLKQSGGGNSFPFWHENPKRPIPVDTTLLRSYSLFNDAVKKNRLTGPNSAEYYYDLMAKKFPGSSYTIDAQNTLTVEFINFAQSKINLYLDCKDPVAIQRLRAQIDDNNKSDEIYSTFDRMEKVARKESFEVGEMLQKAIDFLMPEDPKFAKSLLGRMYFFKARGYFGVGKRDVNYQQALQYAYEAKNKEANAAYVMQTLSSLHIENDRLDSAIYYANKAIAIAPNWRYPYVTLAYAYKRMDRADSAIKYYHKSIDLDKDNADAYVDLGHYFYSLSKDDSALVYYQKALTIDPQNTFANNNIGWINYNEKNYNEAIRYFKKSIADNPQYINPYSGLGKAFFELKQFDSARIYYEKAFASNPDKSFVNIYIGNFYREMKAYDSAKVYYRLAGQLDPTYEESFNYLGKVCDELHQPDSAIFYYRRALEANPYSAFAYLNIGTIYKEKKQADSTYYYFQQAVKMEPGNPSILNTLGVIYGNEKNYDSAKKYFKQALQVRADYKLAAKNLIKVYRDLNQPDSVAAFLKGNTVKEQQGGSSYFNDIGTAFLDQKRYDSARKYYLIALNNSGDNPEVYNNLALAMRGLGKFDSARYYMQIAIQMDDKNPVYWSNMSTIFRSLKQNDSAIYYFQKRVFSSQGQDAQAYSIVGSYAFGLKDYTAAIALFRKSIELASQNPSAYSNIAAAYIRLENFDSAIVYCQKAIQLDDKYLTAYVNLGLAYHTKGQYDSAIIYLSKAIDLDPNDGKNYFRLACSYAMHKESDKAIDNLKKAYRKGYDNKNSLLLDPDLFDLRKLKEFQDLLDKYIPNWRNL